MANLNDKDKDKAFILALFIGISLFLGFIIKESRECQTVYASCKLCEITKNSTIETIKGLYLYPDEVAIIHLKGRDPYNIEFAAQHELCHHFVRKDYYHFCEEDYQNISLEVIKNEIKG